MRKLAAAQPAEFQVWVFTRADLAKFIIIDIVFSSALYAGLRRVNGHDTIAILGSSVGTHLCKYLQNRGLLPKLRAGKPVRQLPWRLTPD
ncbi:hypothetical protein [Paenibacillus sp. USDA918EY]|uniref:hypothetical protein n=1 Tax=Paenibacillus sp. USDA918EY TaxID=2689575 RepID=UPI00135B52F0|nr:hypothetical protein [Paenibacillus sp. USDA918EY]